MVATVAEARTSPFASIEEAIEDIRAGRFVVVVDAPDRENEGDLVIAAQFATPEAVNFMATHGRGLICLCLTDERCDELGLEQMTNHNETPFGTAFTVSIEAREGVSTGISAHDRARTIQVAIDPSKGPADLVQPGHVFPLRARAGGVHHDDELPLPHVLEGFLDRREGCLGRDPGHRGIVTLANGRPASLCTSRACPPRG